MNSLLLNSFPNSKSVLNLNLFVFKCLFAVFLLFLSTDLFCQKSDKIQETSKKIFHVAISDHLILKETGKYDVIYKKWFGSFISYNEILKYFFWIMFIIAGFSLFLILWNFVLRRQVALRTKNLQMEIEERKKIESNLRQSENEVRENHSLLEAILEGTTDVISLKNIDGKYVMVNSAACKAIGKTKEEILGKTDSWLFPSESAEIINSVDAKVIQSGENMLAEERLKTAYGDSYWLANKSPLLDLKGNIIGLIGISRNITNLKMAEKKARESHEKMLDILESLESIVYIADMKSYEILYANNYFRKYFGDIIGQTCWKVIQKGQSGPCPFCTNDKLLNAAGNPKEPYIWEFQNTINGKWYFIQDKAIKWVDDRLVRLEIATDITDKKKAEEEKSKLEAQLLQTQKMEAIGTLAGGIAHDFNNILGAILGYTELAKDAAEINSRQASDLEKVISSAYRAKELVRQILTFSRQTQEEFIIFHPSSLIKETLKMIRASIPANIEIVEDIDSECASIFADPTQLQQVLLNLCTNAYHAMEEKGGKLFVSLKDFKWISNSCASDENNGNSLFVEITVKDTGHGIDPKIQDKIFNPYFTTKVVGKGTGMGLAIVHGIVSRFEGKIIFESSSQGSIFKVYIPGRKFVSIPENIAEETIPTGKERILLIDDEEILLDIGRDMLKRLGYIVTTRQSSLEALETFQNIPDNFDIVLTDQTMPGMNGADLSRRMLQIRPNIPIILCTGYSNLIDEASAKDIGIKEFAFKPLIKRDIARLIRKVLDK